MLDLIVDILLIVMIGTLYITTHTAIKHAERRIITKAQAMHDTHDMILRHQEQKISQTDAHIARLDRLVAERTNAPS